MQSDALSKHFLKDLLGKVEWAQLYRDIPRLEPQAASDSSHPLTQSSTPSHNFDVYTHCELLPQREYSRTDQVKITKHG